MHIALKTTLRCNLHCPHCHVGGLRDTQKDMSVSTARAILSKLPPGSDVTFQGGEPMLLGPSYYERIITGEHAYSMQTNLLLLEPPWLPFMVDRLASVNTSFDVYSSLRAVDPRAWTDRVEMLKRNSISPFVMSMFWKGNQTRAEEIYRFFHALQLPFRLSPVAYEGYARENYTQLLHEPPYYAQALIAIFDLWFMSTDKPVIVEPCLEILTYILTGGSSRKDLSEFLNVTPDGSLYVCGRGEHEQSPLGNLAESTLQEILRHPSRDPSRLYRGILARCLRCDFLPLCVNDCNLYSPDTLHNEQLCAEYRHVYRHIEKEAGKDLPSALQWVSENAAYRPTV
jgi:radical SAM protein with 4Fe4S-binding SPASM domain